MTFSIIYIHIIADVTGAPYQPCANNSDCDYDGGVCWKSDSCELGTCYCDVGFYLSVRRRACAKRKSVEQHVTTAVIRHLRMCSLVIYIFVLILC